MIAFEIQDMTCGHCRDAITHALLGVDGAATVDVDMAEHLVRINSAETNALRLGEAIAAAGFTPRRVEFQAGDPARVSASGCSCATNGARCGMRLSDYTGSPSRPEAPKPQMAGRKPPRAGNCCSSGGSSCGS